MANFFTLTGADVNVTYRIGGNPSFPALTFKSATLNESFKPDQIQSVTTPLGALVTIVTRLTIDAGGTTFSFFLPNLTVPLGQTVNFTSLGIFKNVSGLIFVPHDIVVTWTPVQLEGTARTIFVPL